MAANLVIDIRGPSGGGFGGGSGGGGGLDPSLLQRVVALLERQTAEIERQTRAFQANARSGVASYQQVNVTLNQVTTNITRTSTAFTQITNEAQKAAQSSSKAAEQVARAWDRAASQIRRSLAGAFSGITSGSAFATGGSAGLSPGGLLAGLGDVAGIGVRVGGDLVGGVAKGLAAGSSVITGALSSVLALIPGAGAVLSAGVSIGGGIVSGIISALGGAVSGLASAAGDLAQQIAGELGKALNIALAGTLTVAVASVFKAAQFADISQGFGNLIAAIGGGEGTLQRFRDAARGTVSDLDLMRQANQAVLLGAVQTEEQFGKLIEAGRRLGRATGRTAAEGIADLTVGIGRQSKLILDNLGILVQAEAATERYAAANGKLVSELSEAEKRLAFQEEVFRAIDERLTKLGPEVETFTDSWNRFKTSIENTAVAIGQSLIPIFERLIDPITRIATSIGQAFSRNQEAIIQGITGALDGFLNVVENIAGILESEGFGGIFDRLRVSAVALWQSFAEVAKGAIEFVGTLLESLWDRLKAGLIDAVTSGVAAALSALGTAGLEPLINRALGVNISGAVSSALPGRESARLLREGADATSNRAFLEFELGIEKAKEALVPFTRVVQELTRPATGTAQQGVVQSQSSALIPPPAPPPGGSVVDAVGNAAAIEQALASIAIEIEALSATAQEQIRESIERISQSSEATSRTIQRIEQERERIRERELDESVRTSERIIDEQERSAERIRDAMEKAAQQFAREMEQAQAEFEREFDGITQRRDSALAAIDQRAESVAQALRGAGPEALPLNVRRAIELVDRDRNRQTKDLLRSLTEGLSGQDLAANDGALLDQILSVAGEIQTGAGPARFEALIQANGELALATNELVDREIELLEAQETAAEAQKEALDSIIETVEAQRKVMESQSAELKRIKKESDDLRRALAALS